MDATSLPLSIHQVLLSGCSNRLRNIRFMKIQRVDSNALITKSAFPQCCPKFCNEEVKPRRMPAAFVASSRSPSSSSSRPEAPIAPLHLESPVGQFLLRIQVSHPHLVLAAVEQQLDQFRRDRDAEEDASSSGTDLVLHRRIAEVKLKERALAVEEILYALVVQNFRDAGISLVPPLTNADDRRRRGALSGSDEKLRGVHSVEVYDMIKNHISLLLGDRLADAKTVAHISRLKVGKVYAASVMYGYFLKRIDRRFQLEKTVRFLPDGSDVVGDVRNVEGRFNEERRGRPSGGVKPCLRSYVRAMDPETLQEYATIGSMEAVSIVERQTVALFGRPDVVPVPGTTGDDIDDGDDDDDVVCIRYGGLKRVVLEALTFGSFLYDAESFVDSRYHLVMY